MTISAGSGARSGSLSLNTQPSALGDKSGLIEVLSSSVLTLGSSDGDSESGEVLVRSGRSASASGKLSLSTGDSELAGGISLTSGLSSSPSSAAHVSLVAGSNQMASGGAGQGGSLTLHAGLGQAGGDVSVRSGDASVGAGGTVRIEGGASAAQKAAGDVFLSGGSTTGTEAGGRVATTGGEASSGSASGGGVSNTGGASAAGVGGSVTVSGGSSLLGRSGDVDIITSAALGHSGSGTVTVSSGSTERGVAGDIRLAAGASSPQGVGGSVAITAGAGRSSGSVSIHAHGRNLVAKFPFPPPLHSICIHSTPQLNLVRVGMWNFDQETQLVHLAECPSEVAMARAFRPATSPFAVAAVHLRQEALTCQCVPATTCSHRRCPQMLGMAGSCRCRVGWVRLVAPCNLKREPVAAVLEVRCRLLQETLNHPIVAAKLSCQREVRPRNLEEEPFNCLVERPLQAAQWLFRAASPVTEREED